METLFATVASVDSAVAGELAAFLTVRANRLGKLNHLPGPQFEFAV